VSERPIITPEVFDTVMMLGGDLEAVLKEYSFKGAQLPATSIMHDFNGRKLGPLDFSGAILGLTTLRNFAAAGSDLSHVILKAHSTLRDAYFPGSDFRYADLRLCYIGPANFSNSDLRGANFSQAVFSHVDFTGADLRGAKFTDADMSSPYVIKNTKMDYACKRCKHPHSLCTFRVPGEILSVCMKCKQSTRTPTLVTVTPDERQ